MNQSDSPSSMGSVPEASRGPSGGPVLDIKRLVWLRGPIVLLVSICLGIPATIAAWFLVPTGYTASVELRFLATAPRVLYTDADPTAATPYEKFLNTQISLVTGNAILSRVLDSAEIRSLPSLAAVDDALEYLKSRVSARVQRTSEIVTVTCSMPEKQAAERILQEIVTVYLDYAMGEEASAGTDRLATLTKERDARQMELESQLKTIGDLQGSLGVPIVGQTPLETGEAQLYNESLARAEEDLAKAQNAQSELQARLARIDGFISSASKGNPIYDLGVEDRVGADARVGGLRQEVVKMQASLAEMAEMQQENSPQLKVEQRRLASLTESLAEIELSARKEALQSMRIQQAQEVDVSAKAVEEAQQRVNKFRQLADEYKERLKSATDQFAKLEELKSKAAETRRLLEDVRTNIAQINVESNAPARVRLAAPVTVPGGGPDRKPKLMMMALALAASVGLGVGLGLLLELMDQQVRSSQDVARLTNLPIIAAIPQASEDKLPESVQMPLLVEQAPLSTLANEYRRVLAWFLLPDMTSGEVKSLVVVSPTRGDGKSSLTTNLGAALAQAGRRVLVVDVCYRRPSLQANLGIPLSTGLAEVLGGEVSLDQALHPTRVRGLFVLGPGLDTAGLSGKLASRDMTCFLEFASRQFDHIIIDTPPWLVMADAKLIAPLADGVLVIVGAGASSLGMVRRCLYELNQIKANVLGVVLNGLRRTPGGYMGKNHKLYYGYSHESGSQKGRVAPAPASSSDAGSVKAG